MTLVQQTSLDAWSDIRGSPKVLTQYQVIVQFLSGTLDATDREIQRATGYAINVVTARRNALVKLGRVKFNCTRKCFVTGREVLAWKKQ